MIRKKVILDVDPGVDDALAILLALQAAELDVRGITVANGNVPLSIGLQNALKIVELACSNIDVYAGAEEPLRRQCVYATDFHGDSGLGNAELPSPNAGSAGDAVEFLIEHLFENVDTTVIAVAPLTNLALAESRRPGVLQHAGEVVVMGGALLESGNVTPCAEFNFYVDPEAAQVVLESGAKVTVIPLDATHQVALSGSVLHQYLNDCPTSISAFCEAAMLPGMQHMHELFGTDLFYLHDPLAVAYAIDNSFCEVQDYWVEVETKGELSRGQMISDRRSFLDPTRKKGSKVSCAVEVFTEQVLQFFVERVLHTRFPIKETGSG